MKVNASARAVKTIYDVLQDRYESVTLGKVKSNLASTIARQQQELDEKPSMTMVQSIVGALGDAITGAKGGAVRHLDTDGDGMPDTLYIADNQDPNLATYVWRHNYKGWAASKTGYNGPFVFGATLEDGILADAVTAAHLTAGTIRSKDGKTLFADLDNGILRAVFSEMSVTCTGEVYLPPTYDDVITMLWSISFPEQYPPRDFYDLNGDGVINRDDVILAQKIYLGQADIADCAKAFKTPVSITIDPSNVEEAVLISGVNMWGSEVKTALGARCSRIPAIKGDCSVWGKLAVGGDAILQSLATTATETPKTLSWKDNGDGTFALIGTPKSN